MTTMLGELLSAGLIENLNGDDDRFGKMAKAAQDLAEAFEDDQRLLIRAIVAAIDPNIPGDDPAIVLAEDKLKGHWPTMASVYPNRPVSLLRALLLDGCNLAGKDERCAAIIFLSAADTLPHMKLGREEGVVRNMLQDMASRVEASALDTHLTPKGPTEAEVELEELTSRTVKRDSLLASVVSASGPDSNTGVKVTNPNGAWPSEGPNWSYQFAPKMSEILAGYFDMIFKNIATDVNVVVKQIVEALNGQRQWFAEAISSRHNADATKVNTLWWYEALYSKSIKSSYRELSPHLAAVVMPIDLLDEVAIPSPASVAYVLSEALARLPNAGFDKIYTFQEVLVGLSAAKTLLSSTWGSDIVDGPNSGRLSIRDAVIAVIKHQSVDPRALIEATGIDAETEFSLPKFARAIFRQQQAVELAEPQ